MSAHHSKNKKDKNDNTDNSMETIRLNQRAINAMKHNRIDETIDILKVAAKLALDFEEDGDRGVTRSAADVLLFLQLESVPSFYKSPDRMLCKFISITLDDYYNNDSATTKATSASTGFPPEVLAFVVVYNLALAFHLSGSLVRERANHLDNALQLYETAHQILESHIRVERPLLAILILCNRSSILVKGSDEQEHCLGQLSGLVDPTTTTTQQLAEDGFDQSDIKLIQSLMRSGTGMMTTTTQRDSPPSSVTVTDDSSMEDTVPSSRKRKGTAESKASSSPTTDAVSDRKRLKLNPSSSSSSSS